MGKNKDEELDDFGLDDLDSDLDFGDWDEPENGGGPPENRDPVKQTLNTVKNATLDAVLPKSQRDRIILDALPEEAAGAYDGYRDVESAVSDVYSHTKEELVKTQRNLKIQTRQLLPTMKKYLPESITSKVDNWSKPEDSWGNNYDPNQALLDRGVADVFGQYMQQQEEQKAADTEQNQQEAEDAQTKEVKDNIKETVSNLKQDKLLEVMIGMSKDVNSFTTLQHSVTVNWQRKSLELQYRQLFALQEIAKLSQTRFERDTPALEAIVKNTALPDYAKEEFGEIQGAMFKRKIAEWISPAQYTEQFITRIQENIKKKVTESLGEGRSLMSLVMGELQEDDDMDMEDTSIVAPDQQKDNLTQKGIGSAAGFLAKRYINPQRDKLTAKIREKMSENEDVDRFFNRALYNFSNIPQIANSAMSGERDSTLGGFFQTLNDLGIAPAYGREQVALNSRDGEYLEKAAKFDNRSYITLNEVIPNWLSKINTSIRAGYGEDTDEVYDLTARTFVDRDTVASRVRDFVGKDEHRERLRNRISEVTDLIDTKGEMSVEERAKVGKFLESRISEAKEFNAEALIENSEVLDRYMDWGTKEKFSEMLKREAGNNAAKLSNTVNNELGGMMGSIGSYQQRVDQMVAQYGEQALLDAGIINYNKEEDRLETVKDLTNVYQDLGKLERRQLDPETEAKLQARFNRATSAAIPETDEHLRRTTTRNFTPESGEAFTQTQTPLSPKTLVAGLTRVDLQEVLYGKDNTETNLIELIRRDKPTEETQPVRVDLESVVNAIKECCSKETVESILEHVRHMDEAGVITLVKGRAVPDDKDGEDPRIRKPRFRDYLKFGRMRRTVEGEGREEKEERKGFFRRAGGIVGDTFGLAQDGVTGTAKWFGGKVFGRKEKDPNKPRQSVIDRIKSVAGGPVKTAFEAARSVPRGFGAFGKAAFGARDIYDGEGNIVLSGQKLKDGHYFKKVGEDYIPMTTIEELNKAEAIYDSTGNVVLSSDQLKEAGELSFYKGKRWYKVTEVVGDKLGGGLNTLVNLPKQFLAGKKNPIKEAVKWFGRYPDMYVGGRLVIRANLMREGHYLCNGKVIESPEDIKGEVRDINDRVVISEEDFKQENFKITDRYGREVRTPLGRMAGRLGNVFGRVQQGLLNIPRRAKIAARTIKRSRPAKFLKRKVADPITTTLSKPFKWMAFGGKDKDEKKDGNKVGWFSQNVIGGGTRGKTNGILVRIYQLLNSRMAGDPEPEDWINQMGVEASSRLGKRLSGVKDRLKETFKRRKESAEKRFDLKGKFAKLKPKNVKETILERFKGKGKADLSDAKEKLLNREGAAANFYRDRMAKTIAEREQGFAAKMKKINPKDMVKQAKNLDMKTSLEKVKEKLSGKKKEIENTETGRKVRRKVRDTVTGRDRKLDEAAMSLLDRKGGTREHYRDHIANRIKELKEDNHEKMTTGIRGRVNEAVFGMKRKESAPLKERFTKKKDDIQAKMLEKLNQMNEASQGMWFNTMQSTAEKNGMSQQGLSNLFSRFGKRFKFGKQSAGSDWFKFMRRGGAPEENDSVGIDPRTKKPKKQKRRGKGLRWVDMLLTGMGAIVGGLPGAIAGALLRPLGGMLMKALGRGAVGLAAKALPAVAGVAGTAVSAVGGMVTAGAGAVASGVAAIGGLPVIAVGAAVAAVGWGIYKLATRKRAYYLDKLRLAQYGLQDYHLWSTDESAKVRYLEDNLKRYVTFENTGAAILRGLSAEEAVKLGQGYGIDKENEKELVAFHAYLQNRFIPIYLNWLAAIRKVESAPALEDVGSSNKVRKGEMQKIFNEVKLSADSPYFKQIVDPRKADRGWFKSATDWVGFTTDELLTGEEVEEVTKEVGQEISARRDDRKRKDDKSITVNAAVTATFDLKDSIAAKRVEDRKIVLHGAFDSGKYSEREIDAAAERLKNIPFSKEHIGEKKAKKETLHALEGVRIKAYGLKTLSGSLVNDVLDLERNTLPFIDTKTGNFTGDMGELLAVFGGSGDSDKAMRVRYWFRHRFLPTFTTYVLAVKRYIPAANPLSLVLTGRYLYEIASMVVQAKASINGSMTSIWYIRQVPWDEVNDDPNSVSDELETLKKLSKDTEMRVDVMPKDKFTAKVKLNKNRYDGSALKKIQDGQPETSRSPGNVMQFPNGAGDGGSTINPPSVSSSGVVAGTLRHAPVINQEPGEGDYLSIKESKQDAPDIINEAARVAGVNPLVMMTMAMIESSLNPNAAAKTSSAKGLYQFLDGTWEGMMRKYANKHGIPEGTDQFDPVANALLGAEFLKENAKVSEGVMKRPASAVDYYIPHFFGAGGARTFYRHLLKKPNAPAASVLKAQAKANKPIFYKNGRARSFAEVYQHFTSKMSSNETHARKYVPNATPSAATNVVSMFNNTPAHNESRREEVVKAKADRDASTATKPTQNTAIASASAAYGGGSEPAPAPSPRTMENKAKAFVAENPNATEADKDVYAERMAQNAYGGKPEEEVKPSNPAVRTNEILSQQLGVQQSMASELVNIRKLLQMVLDGKEGSREYEQLKTDIARNDAKPKPSLNVEHGQSRISTKRVSNL